MTDNTENRIRLAEAMGYEPEGQREWCDPMWFTPYENDPADNGVGLVGFDDLPDPYTDANDDYAVLEWGVDNLGKPFIDAVNELIVHEPAQYDRGDYARAALKVLDSEALQEGES